MDGQLGLEDEMLAKEDGIMDELRLEDAGGDSPAGFVLSGVSAADDGQDDMDDEIVTDDR